MPQSSRGPFGRPPKVVAYEGEVVMIGQWHLHGAMTPQAARETAEKLLQSAADAEAQLDEEDAPPG